MAQREVVVIKVRGPMGLPGDPGDPGPPGSGFSFTAQQRSDLFFELPSFTPSGAAGSAVGDPSVLVISGVDSNVLALRTFGQVAHTASGAAQVVTNWAAVDLPPNSFFIPTSAFVTNSTDNVQVPCALFIQNRQSTVKYQALADKTFDIIVIGLLIAAGVGTP
jgi:hypothetical protein